MSAHTPLGKHPRPQFIEDFSSSRRDALDPRGQARDDDVMRRGMQVSVFKPKRGVSFWRKH
jgi:hypothetical protein